jgi:DNA-binding CsgD family transcriptional regulator
MASVIENKNRNQQRSDPGTTKAPTAIQTGAAQAFKKGQETNDNIRQEEGVKRTKKRRPTKVALNDTLRRIRHLIIEGRSNLEIQNILQLEERTFYRYMAKIYEIDKALFAEQEKKTIITEIAVFKDRLLKSYQWYIAMAENENMNARIRMEARRDAVDVALALVKLKIEGLRLIEEGGGGERLLEKLYQNSR